MAADSQSAVNPPTWLDTALIQKALHSGGGVNAYVKVKDITIAKATAPGDNYSSVIYRVKATLADGAGERSLLVKVVPEGEAIAQAVVGTGAFKTESALMSGQIPAMKALLDEACLGRFSPFTARCLLHGSSPSPFLVLEDLKPQGFVMAKRHRGLGLRHSLLAIRTLARFHAASAALLEKDKSVFKEFPNPFRSSNGSWDAFILPSFQAPADLCRKWPGYEEYADILERLKPKAPEVFAEINNPSRTRFNVLAHGDYWTNNMMFRYDETGKLNDFRMVDLQISHLASPSIDLLYFLNTSLSDEVLERHEYLLLREYHFTLIETLDLLGLNGPSFNELMTDINLHSAYSLFGALLVWPIARAQGAPDLNATASGDTSASNFMYENEPMKRWLQRILPEYKRRGWMNF